MQKPSEAHQSQNASFLQLFVGLLQRMILRRTEELENHFSIESMVPSKERDRSEDKVQVLLSSRNAECVFAFRTGWL